MIVEKSRTYVKIVAVVKQGSMRDALGFAVNEFRTNKIKISSIFDVGSNFIVSSLADISEDFNS